jgi:hypothetical protein
MSSAVPFGSSERESVAPLPAALPFTVDTWPRGGHAENGRVQFLTHAHKDHTVGIEEGAEHLCCSPTTLSLLRIKFPRVAARLDAGGVAFTPLNDWDTLLLHAPERLGGYAYTVTSVPLANHCQGWEGRGAVQSPAAAKHAPSRLEATPGGCSAHGIGGPVRVRHPL